VRAVPLVAAGLHHRGGGIVVKWHEIMRHVEMQLDLRESDTEAPTNDHECGVRIGRSWTELYAMDRDVLGGPQLFVKPSPR